MLLQPPTQCFIVFRNTAVVMYGRSVCKFTTAISTTPSPCTMTGTIGQPIPVQVRQMKGACLELPLLERTMHGLLEKSVISIIPIPALSSIGMESHGVQRLTM